MSICMNWTSIINTLTQRGRRHLILMNTLTMRWTIVMPIGLTSTTGMSIECDSEDWK
jgi:hypothetical protein